MDIVIELLKWSGILIPAILVFLSQQYKFKSEIKSLKSKEKHDAVKIGYMPHIMSLRGMGKIDESIDRIFDTTKITRFVVLIGVNGKEEMKHVTAIVSRYKGKADIDQSRLYRSLPIDGDYRTMIKWIEKYGSMMINVSKMEEGLLKSIYQDEDIKHSYVNFINRTSIDENNDVVLFCSLSTEDKDEVSFRDKLVIDSELNNVIIPTIKSLNNT